MKKLSILVFLYLGLSLTSFSQQKDSIAPLDNSMKRIISISPTDAARRYIGINYEYLFPNKHLSFTSGIGFQIPKQNGYSGFSLESAVKYYLKAAPNGFFLNAGLKLYSKTGNKELFYSESDTSNYGFFNSFSENLPDKQESFSISNLQFTFGGGFQDTYGKNNQWVLEALAYFAVDLTDYKEINGLDYTESSTLPSGNKINRRYYVYYPNTYDNFTLGSFFNARINIGYRF